MDSKDCGPTCLKMIAKFYGKDIAVENIRLLSSISKEGVSLNGLSDAAQEIGFNAYPVELDEEEILKKVPLPCIVFWEDEHFVVLYEIKGGVCIVGDPKSGIEKIPKSVFLKKWKDYEVNGYALLLEKGPAFDEVPESKSERKGLSFLLTYFKPFRKQIIQIGIGLLFGSFLQLILPFMTQALVDYGVNYGDIHFVYLILIAQIVVFLSRSSVEYIRGWILLYITGKVNISLLSDFLEKLMDLPLSYFETRSSSDIVQRILDNRKIEEFLSTYTLTTLFSVFTILIFSLVLLYYSPYIFFVFVTGSFVYFQWSFSFLKKRKVIDDLEFKEASNNQQSIYQLISGMFEIKLNGSQTKRKWEWEKIQGKLFRVSEKGLRLDQRQSFGALFINELTNIIITFISASLVINGDITLGAMLSVQYIIGQLNLPLGNLIGFLRVSQDAKLSLERLREIDILQTEKRTDSPFYGFHSKAPLCLKDVSFRYGSKRTPLVLDDININFESGRTTAIVGNSGSGKTTLIKLLLKYYDNYEGSITIDGRDIRDLDTREWRKLFGTVMQNGYLFDDTIESNIAEPDSNSLPDQDRLKEAIKIANLTSTIEKMPKGIRTNIGPNGSSLSGGESQRIMIARMVYKNPQIIIMDEATSSLDSNNEREIINNLETFLNKKTTIIIAHRMSTVRKADKIIVINNGKVVETGNHKTLIEKKGFYFDLIKNQLEISH